MMIILYNNEHLFICNKKIIILKLNAFTSLITYQVRVLQYT